eukprot:TRINITY_DN34106_c0_g1_i1.p1 TRINITY_DN34106_c0_g1~~TRINITY_DN34106_c0_g1_i1.p1  ORF type:complete len:774 (-),score=91.37 TRINITY_DN34106_c0_g1_i1:15-2135(-)
MVSIDADAVRLAHLSRKSSCSAAVACAGRSTITDVNQSTSSIGSSVILAATIRLLALTRTTFGLSLSEARSAIKQGRVLVDKAPLRDPAQLVDPGVNLFLTPHDGSSYKLDYLPVSDVRVELEADFFFVVWKPVDVSVDDLPAIVELMIREGSLFNVDSYDNQRKHEEIFVASRLRKSLSGLVVLAKGKAALLDIKRSIGERGSSDDSTHQESFETEHFDTRSASRCHFHVVIDCSASVPNDHVWKTEYDQIESLRIVRSTFTTRGNGQLQLIECICKCPPPGSYAISECLRRQGAVIIGRDGKRAKRPLKCLTSWTLALANGSRTVSVAPDERLTRTITDEHNRWLRRAGFDAKIHGIQTEMCDDSASGAGTVGVVAAYERGWELFCDYQFLVSPVVMVPRRGTEAVVATVLEEVRQLSRVTPALYQRNGEQSYLLDFDEVDLLLRTYASSRIRRRSLRIMDVGVGSGCIGISALLGICMDTELSQSYAATAVGVDVCAEALDVAKRNAQRLLPKSFSFGLVQADFADLSQPGVADILMTPSQRNVAYSGFDVIVSNPPYLTRRKAAEVLGIVDEIAEPMDAFVLRRSASVRAAIDAAAAALGISRTDCFDGAIAAYAVIAQGLRKAHSKGYQLLNKGGIIVLEVPPDKHLERAVQAVFEHRSPASSEAPASPVIKFVRSFTDANGVSRGMVFKRCDDSPRELCK